MRKHRVVFFIPRMGGGGAERVIATLSNGLVQKNYEVIILCLMDNNSYYELDRKVKHVGANLKISKKNRLMRNLSLVFNVFRAYFFYKKQIDLIKPSIVVSFLPHTNLIALFNKIFNTNIKLVVSERNDPTIPNFIARYLIKIMYKRSNLLVVQSSFVKNYFNNIEKSKVRVIENPINEKSLPTEIATVRKKKIVGVGRLFRQKNFELLIKGFNKIHTKFPGYTLEIYGEGPLRENLQKLIDDLNLSSKVYLMGAKKNVMKYIYDSEIFVMTSNYEGFPNALVEAMASGLPVICTDFSTGVAKELVQEENGLIIPVGSEESLVIALITLLSSVEKRKEMASNNWKIRGKLAERKIIEKWENELVKIIEG